MIFDPELKFFWYFSLRYDIAYAFGKCKIASALFSRFAEVSFLGEKMRSAILSRNMTKRANADTRLGHNEFFKQNINRQISTHEL